MYWTDEQIDYFAGIVRSYRGEVGYPEYKDERGRCRVVQRSEVRDSEYSLNPRMYIDSPEKIKSKYSYAQKLEKLNEQL